jgi:Txe/YoeB family toxin of Txe-Axe toxin-antitoxin module
MKSLLATWPEHIPVDKHRLVYQVLEEWHVVEVIRMWTHYE